MRNFDNEDSGICVGEFNNLGYQEILLQNLSFGIIFVCLGKGLIRVYESSIIRWS